MQLATRQDSCGSKDVLIFESQLLLLLIIIFNDHIKNE